MIRGPRLPANFSIDEKVAGKVTRVSEYGVFCGANWRIMGLIHIQKFHRAKNLNR